MKYDWKKQEKNFYSPTEKPEIVIVPSFTFFTIQGKGNPNDEAFCEYIGILYSLSYAVKMSPKSGIQPPGFFDYAVYPLEGVWDLDEDAKNSNHCIIDKNKLIFNLMIRQPDFVTNEFAAEILQKTKKKKPHLLLNAVKFETIEEGRCIQKLHLGSYDSEPESFKLMEQLEQEQKLKRKYHIHREIYLSDARKTEKSKLRTILRYQVE